MSDYKRYDEVAVGDVYPAAPLSFAVTDTVVDAFLAATGDTSKAYGRNGESRRAPSMLASVYLIDLLKARASPPGGIHAKQAVRFHRPIAVGETLTLQARVTEKYVRKERPYIVSEFEARGASGDLVSDGRITTIWGKDQ